MEPVYPEGKIEYAEAGKHLVIGVQRLHKMPRDYLGEFLRRVDGIDAIKVQMDGIPPDDPKGEYTECIENVAKRAFAGEEGREFEPLAMSTGSRKPLSMLLIGTKGFQMPFELLEVYIAAIQYEAMGAKATQDPKELAQRIRAAENTWNFSIINPEKGARNYIRALNNVPAGTTAMHNFYLGCREFVNAVHQYRIICPDILKFGKVEGRRAGVVVGIEHMAAAVHAMQGKLPDQPQHWEQYMHEEEGTMPHSHIEAVQAVKKVIREPEPTTAIGDLKDLAVDTASATKTALSKIVKAAARRLTQGIARRKKAEDNP